MSMPRFHLLPSALVRRFFVWGVPLLALLLLLPAQPQAQAATAPPSAAALGVSLLSSSESGITFDLQAPPLLRTPLRVGGQEMVSLSIPGYGRTGETGAPDLPQTQVTIALPPGANPRLVVSSLAQERRSDRPVAPPTVETLLDYDFDDPASLPTFDPQTVPDPAVYDANALFPAEPVVIAEISTVRAQRVAHLFLRPVQVNPVSGEQVFHTHLRITVTFEGAQPEGQPAGRESATFEALLAATLLNYEQGRAWRTAAAPTSPLTSPCLDDNAFRIAVTATGMHEISATALQTAGLSGPVNQDKLRLCHDDSEVAVKLLNRDGTANFAGADGLLFYGEAIKTQETTTNVYWLTYGGESAPNGLRMATVNGSNGTSTTLSSYAFDVHAEQDLLYISNYPMNDTSDHWYWDRIAYNFSGIASSFATTVSIPNLAPGSYDVPLALQVTGHRDPDPHPIAVAVNGTTVDTLSFTGTGFVTPVVLTTTVSSTLLQPGNNTITLTALDFAPGDANSGAHLFWIDWLTLTPRRTFVAQSDRLAYVQPLPGLWTYVLSGFSARPDVFDVSDPQAPVEVLEVSGTTTVTFTRFNDAPVAYQVATTAGHIQVAAAAIRRDSPPLSGGATLLDTGQQADYIIITNPTLESGLTSLIARRQSQGLNVRVTYTQDIFDEFSYGRYDPEAIRRFLEYAWTNWQDPKPTFVLLAGDGSYDHRNLLGLNGTSGNLVPVYLKSGVDSNIGETAADNMYVNFSGDELPEMLIGRLPAQSAAELQAMAERIVTYETTPLASWHGNHLFVADNGLELPNCELDPAGDFFQTVIQFLAEAFPVPEYMTLQRSRLLFYAPATCYPDNLPYYRRTADAMEADILQALTDGQQFVIYTGHSGSTFWSKDGPSGYGFFSTSVVENNLQNGNRTPIMLPMTCLEGSYHRPQFNSLSEALLKKSTGGAVASFAPTGLQVQQGHDFLLRGFYDGAFVQDLPLLGEAVFAAKVRLNGTSAFQDLHDTFMLLGDPAMNMRVFQGSEFLFAPVAPRG